MHALRFLGSRQIVGKIVLVILLIPIFVYLRSVYRDRISAFGCFDDCFNYGAGYFLLSGKKLYSEIFFNHQPLGAYMSALIQFFTKPDSLYRLIYEHRMFLISFSIVSDVFLVMRFGVAGFGFTLLYESTKGYVFGERFLGESFIVYPLVYLVGLTFEGVKGKKLAVLTRLV